MTVVAIKPLPYHAVTLLQKLGVGIFQTTEKIICALLQHMNVGFDYYYPIMYGICSLIFAVVIYPFSRKWTRNTTKFIVDIQVTSAQSVNQEYLVQTKGNEIIPLGKQRQPFFTLIMFNLFIVSLVLSILPDASFAECQDGTIIYSKFIDDGIPDCPDKSDEYIDPTFDEPLEEFTVDFVSNVEVVLGMWGIILAMCGPIFMLFYNTRMMYEYCPVLILDSKHQSITRFGDRKNKIIGPMIGSGAILLTLQLILREGWGSASLTEMGAVLVYILAITIGISSFQIISLTFGLKRIRKEANELALIMMGFRLARPVTIYWKFTERSVKQRLIEYNTIPTNAIVLSHDILKKYGLEERYIDQRKFIESLKEKSVESAALMGFT